MVLGVAAGIAIALFNKPLKKAMQPRPPLRRRPEQGRVARQRSRRPFPSRSYFGYGACAGPACFSRNRADARQELDLVLPARERVALVVGDHVLDRDLALPQRAHDQIGLARAARADRSRPRRRRADRRSCRRPRSGEIESRNSASLSGSPNSRRKISRMRPLVVAMNVLRFATPNRFTPARHRLGHARQPDQHGVAAVAAAVDDDAVRVRPRLRGGPAAGGLDVLEGVEPLGPVVGRLEGAAEAARAAHVGLHPRVALRQEERGGRRPADLRAARGPAVVRDDHRQLPGAPSAGTRWWAASARRARGSR